MRALSRIIAVVTIVAVPMLFRSTQAFASTTWGCTGTECQVGVGTPGTAATSGDPPTSQNGGASNGPCPPGQTVSYSLDTEGGQPVKAQPGDLNPITGAPVPAGSELEVVSCNGNYLTTIVIPPTAGAGVSGAQLARQAFSTFVAAPPTPKFSPTTSVVGVQTWLWLQSGWASQSATASVPGLSATVTAQPTSVEWSMGDGGREDCDGPGKAWDPNQPDASTDCSYSYPVAGHFTVTVTVYYRTSWSASDGTAGQLAAITGRTEVPITVDEIQAVNNR